MQPVQKVSWSPLVVVCIAATWVVWGSTYLAIKYALVSFPPYFQMGSRFLVASVLLFAAMRLRGAPWPNRTQWRNALIVGTLMLGGGMGSTATAEVSVGSGLVVAFIAVVPLIIAALNRLWGIVPSRLEIAGIVTGLVGVLLLTQGDGFQASPKGLFAISAACICWSLGSVLSQRTFPLAPGPMGFASEMLCGGVVLMVLSPLTHEGPEWPPQASAVAAWAYLIVFGSLIAFNAYMVLLARTPASIASSYTFVNPVIAMLLGVVVANEVVTKFEWLACAVVLAGVFLTLRGATRKAQVTSSTR